ncbi:transcription termination/antitermination protein NusG [Chlamydia sp. 04-14]|uniref:transcription termination/antitermination protein NusG n=1 Tax=Chlamydia TaxID=810 RepID=UPI002FC86752
MFKWYVVQVFTAQEKKVKKALEDFKESSGMADFIQEIVLPIENVMEVKKGEHKVVEKFIWPGYLLIKMHLTDESWLYVKNNPGVVEFLGGGVPLALSEDEVRNILKDLEEKKAGVVQKHKFDVGSRVKINDGVFVNFIGVVSEVFHDKGRLSVMVSIFGRETRVDDLEFWQVEEVALEQESE